MRTRQSSTIRKRSTPLHSRGSAPMQVRLPEAQAEFETAISLDPNSARTYLHLGETLLYLGQPEAGIPPLEQAIRLRTNEPNLAITYWALGTCHLLSGRVEQA